MNIQNKRAVGIFNNRVDTEKALTDLKNSGFNMDNVSLIVRDNEATGIRDSYREHNTAHGNKSDEGALTGAATGGIVGTIAGLLVGLGTLVIPGLGPIILAGATATAVATTLAGTAIGTVAGGLIGALIGLGIPEEHARVYSDRITQGHYLVMITADLSTIARAHRILQGHNIEEWNIYDAPSSHVTPKHTRPEINENSHIADKPLTHTIDKPEIKTNHTRDVEDDPRVIIVDKRKKPHR